MDSSPEAWADELEAFGKTDRASHIPQNPVLVVGGRRVKLWRGLEDTLDSQEVLMRGLGDATVNDIVYNYDRLIGFYRPESLVFLPSNSEFHLRDNKLSEDFVRGVKELAKLDQAHAVTQHLYLISPLKTPLYKADYAKMDEISKNLAAWAMQQPRISYLDANALLGTNSGGPNPRYFRNDGVNLNNEGYVRLSLLLRSAMDAPTPSDTNNI
ncbi:MAG: hypothetical protein ACJAYC_000619 [Halieaceae bacterium]|jgi:hypothetical protein